MPSHDIVIVGAAPAGSLAALVLARAGHRVALLDRAAFPRAKVCGNCINPSAWKIWQRLELTDSYAALPHQELTVTAESVVSVSPVYMVLSFTSAPIVPWPTTFTGFRLHPTRTRNCR